MKPKSADQEIIGCALLDNGCGRTLISWGALVRLGLRQGSGSLTTEAIIVTARISLVSSASMNVKVPWLSELPIIRPIKRLLERPSHWPNFADIPFDESYGEFLVLIECDLPGAHWVLKQKLKGRGSPFAMRTLLGWVVYGPPRYAACEARLVNRMSTGILD